MAKTSSPSPIASSTDSLAAPQGFVFRVFKTTWLGIWLALATLAVFLPLTLAALFSRTGNSMFHLARCWAWIILKVTGVRVVVRGNDRFDRSRSYMIIANHQSHFDGPALALGLRGLQFRWIAKKELLKIPFFGHCLHSSRNIFIDRSDRAAAVASIRNGIRRLPAGAGVMCFAEGTRSATGRPGVFKKGGFAAAIENGMPILPVTINGSQHVLPKDSLCFRSGVIELVVDDPIETSGLTLGDLEPLIVRTRGIIQANRLSPTPQ